MILGIKATLGASAVVDFKAVSDVKDKSRLVLQAMFLLELQVFLVKRVNTINHALDQFNLKIM